MWKLSKLNLKKLSVSRDFEVINFGYEATHL
jgi:hypothetical protein